MQTTVTLLSFPAVPQKAHNKLHWYKIISLRGWFFFFLYSFSLRFSFATQSLALPSPRREDPFTERTISFVQTDSSLLQGERHEGQAGTATPSPAGPARPPRPPAE